MFTHPSGFRLSAGIAMILGAAHLRPALAVPPNAIPFYDELTPDARKRIQDEGQSVWQRETLYYWADRRTVGLVVHFDSTGTVTAAELQKSYASGREADSVRSVAQRWVLSREWARDRHGKWPAVVALDPSGNVHRDRSEALPQPVGALLRKPPLADWLSTLQSIHPEASPEYFRCYGSFHVFKIRAEGMLQDKMMRRKASCGMLLDSPGGTYVLDPFVGIDVTEHCELGADVDLGFAIFETSSGGRTWYDVSSTSSIQVSTWADDSTFVLAGSGRFENADLAAELPMIWVGNARSGIMRRYLGAPMDPVQEGRFWPLLWRLRERTYPRLTGW